MSRGGWLVIRSHSVHSLQSNSMTDWMQDDADAGPSVVWGAEAAAGADAGVVSTVAMVLWCLLRLPERRGLNSAIVVRVQSVPG